MTMSAAIQPRIFCNIPFKILFKTTSKGMKHSVLFLNAAAANSSKFLGMQ
jgi:hypothetical protein